MIYMAYDMPIIQQVCCNTTPGIMDGNNNVHNLLNGI